MNSNKIDKKQEDVKTCLECEHFRFESGQPSYSEYTPGYDAIIECKKGHWKLNFISDTEYEFRNYMLIINNCKDFEESEQIKKIKGE